jgi:hypothetical protein
VNRDEKESSFYLVTVYGSRFTHFAARTGFGIFWNPAARRGV